MKAVEPPFPTGIVARRATFAENQPEYEPLPALVEPNGTVHTRWQFTEEERRAVYLGADVTLTVLTFGGALQPVQLAVEGVDQPVEIEGTPA